MTSKLLNRILMAGLLIIAGGLFGGTYVIKSELEKRSKSLVDKRAEVIKLEQEQSSLFRAKKDVQKYKPLAEISKSIVPQDKDQAQTVREIVKIAERHNISIGSITFPTSTLGEAAQKPTGSTSAPAASNKAALSQLTPVKNIPGVYLLQINITSNADKPVSYTMLRNFLSDLEQNRRTALVSNISINPDEKNRNAISFTLTLDEYIKP